MSCRVLCVVYRLMVMICGVDTMDDEPKHGGGGSGGGNGSGGSVVIPVVPVVSPNAIVSTAGVPRH